MKILVIGGTQFIGRHVTQALLDRGDEVTLFHRGRTNPDLFPEAVHVLGDRNADLNILAGGEWDAVVDTSAYFPRQVRLLAQALLGRIGAYVHVSSVSAYAGPFTLGYDETIPLAVLPDPTTEVVDDGSYGGLKALCEREARTGMGEGSGAIPVAIVRPTFVVGPWDHTGRFTWWVERMAHASRVVAPGPRETPFQVIDVRDLAAFLVTLAHDRSDGTYHVAHPMPPYSFGDFIDLVQGVVGQPGLEVIWAPSSLLRDHGVSDAAFPLWAGTDPDRFVLAADPSQALAAGLSLRPLSETIEQTHRWVMDHPAARELGPTFGLDSALEERLVNLLTV